MQSRSIEEQVSDFILLRNAKGEDAAEVVSSRSQLLTRVCKKFDPIVQSIASSLMSKYRTTTTMITFEDFVSAGNIGLVEAVDCFDPKFGVPFNAFARLRIRLAMFEELRRYDDVPRSLRREKAEFDYAEAELSYLYGDDVDVGRLAGFLNTDVETLEQKRAKLSYSIPWFVSNSILSDDGTSVSIFDMIASADDCEVEVLFNQVTCVINKYITKCRSLEQKVFELYFMKGLTLREIGLVLGVTKQRVGQIKDRMLSQLRQCFLEEMDEETLKSLAGGM